MTRFQASHTEMLRTALQTRAQQLRDEVQSLQDEQSAHDQAHEDLPREPDANQSRDTTDREVRRAEGLRDQQELQAVRAALKRIEDGSYGECVQCGKGIALERLQASPQAARCIQCQTQHEAQTGGAA